MDGEDGIGGGEGAVDVGERGGAFWGEKAGLEAGAVGEVEDGLEVEEAARVVADEDGKLEAMLGGGGDGRRRRSVLVGS